MRCTFPSVVKTPLLHLEQSELRTNSLVRRARIKLGPSLAYRLAGLGRSRVSATGEIFRMRFSRKIKHVTRWVLRSEGAVCACECVCVCNYDIYIYTYIMAVCVCVSVGRCSTLAAGLPTTVLARDGAFLFAGLFPV